MLKQIWKAIFKPPIVQGKLEVGEYCIDGREITAYSDDCFDRITKIDEKFVTIEDQIIGFETKIDKKEFEKHWIILCR